MFEVKMFKACMLQVFISYFKQSITHPHHYLQHSLFLITSDSKSMTGLNSSKHMVTKITLLKSIQPESIMPRVSHSQKSNPCSKDEAGP